MTTALARIPGEVVYRHTCHCKTATERPADGDPDEHVFTVNGEPFPWHLSERGAIITRSHDNIYKIDVEILLLDKTSLGFLPCSYEIPAAGAPYVPLIDGEPFPWTCDESGCQLSFSHKQIPTLRLVFLAFHVDTNSPVDDQRPGVARAVYGAGGDLIEPGVDECFWCGELIDGVSEMFRHHDEHHPDTIHIDEHGHKGYRIS